MEGITYIVRWIAQPTACNYCKELHGREWIVNELEEAELIFISLEHLHGHCEIDVEIEVDLEKLILPSIAEARAQIEELKTEIQNMRMSYHQVREFETLINRSLMLLERATGSKELRQAINLMQRAMTIARLLQLQMIKLQASMGPVGWAMLGITAITTVAMTVDFATEMSGR